MEIHLFRPQKANEDLSLDKPLHVMYNVSKLAYRIWVILIANKRVKKEYVLISYRERIVFSSCIPFLLDAHRDHTYSHMKTEWVWNMFRSLGFTEVTKFWRLEPYKLRRYLNAPHKSPHATILGWGYDQAGEEHLRKETEQESGLLKYKSSCKLLRCFRMIWTES
jgi:hypothetical protein